MIIANGKGRVSTLAVDDDLDMNGRNVTNADVVSVNDHVTLVGAQRFPGKGFRSNERNGWYVSKDNNDIERKFFKDDFSVDSSENWLVETGSVTVDTINKKMVVSGIPVGGSYYYLKPTIPVPYGRKITVVFNIDPSETNNTAYRYLDLYLGNVRVAAIFRNNNATEIACALPSNIIPEDQVAWKVIPYNPGMKVEVEIGATTAKLWINGVLKNSGTLKSGVDLSGEFNFRLRVSSGMSVPFELLDVTVSPSISYADDFATDTVSGANGRYQPVLGTVAYDDTNKRMNVTTANGKASGRLKSYKFCEGSQIYDVLLPTGADGDFICLATHSANGLMTDGIGVGLQSDGAGNWNLATLSRTTVTEGADSGLDDADVARIEIEKDLSGAYWYYIYDASGTKPTTATGKLFTTLSEGYTGWYANGAGAETQTFPIDNISIRAESIVGRTNVEVTEPFWFRDEFGINDSGRWYGYPSGFVWDTANNELDVYGGTSDATAVVTPTLKNPTMSFDWNVVGGGGYARIIVVISGQTIPTSVATSPYYIPDCYYILFDGGNTKIALQKGAAGGATVVEDLTGIVLTPYYNTTITIEKTDTEIIVKSGETTIATFTAAGVASIPAGKMGLSNKSTMTCTSASIKNLQISGTRIYNKPIHRGAMLESYHDGTQEVVGTTFIDDCQWDRSEEYTLQNGTATYDAANGYYTIAVTSGLYGVQELNGVRVTEGIIGVEINRKELIYGGLLVSWDGTLTLDGNSKKIPNNGLAVYMSPTIVNAILYINGALTVSTAAFTPSGWHKLQVNIIGTTANIYVDGVLRKTITNAIISAYDHVGIIGYKTSAGDATKWRNLQIIAASPDASNGIAACIPPIGGGARYGVEEEVYHTYTNEVRKGKYLVSTCVKTTNADAEAIEMYLENTTDSTAITEDDSKTVAIALTDTNYMDVEKEMELGYADRGDTLKVAVRKTDAATEVSPACYVEMLNVTPTVEVI